MHIPDGYLGPQTCLGAFAAMIPAWAWASARLKRTLRARRVPLLALSAAFCFVLMMFNVPVPGGTSGHAVGAVLVAILMGPCAAVVAISATLAVQALVFGDGGVTAFAANCLTMALVMPFAGWLSFRLLAGKAPVGSRVRWFSAAAAGYIGLNAGAFAAALLFGLQPALAHDAAGRPLYGPFGLSVAVPAMMIGHLLLFGFVEAAVTGMAVAYLERSDPGIYGVPAEGGTAPAPPRPRMFRRLAWALVALILLTPLGLILPAWLGAGTAWGEWSGEETRKLMGFLPAGLEKASGVWRAPFPAYGSPARGGGSWLAQSAWYVGSAALGAVLLLAVLRIVRWIVARAERHAETA